MNSKLNIQDIVDLLVANNEISIEEAEMFVAQFFSLIEKGLSTDGLVKVKDFGSFKLTHIQARESVDVNTQEKIVIPAHRRVSFLPAPLLKDLVNKPFAHFETTPLNDGIFMDGISQETTSDNEIEDLDGDNNEDKTYPEDFLIEETPVKPVSDETTIEEQILEEDNSEMQNDELSAPIVGSLPTDENITKETTTTETTPNETAQVENLSAVDETEMPNSEEVEPKEEIELIPQESIVDTPIKPPYRKPKTKGKLRRYILRWDIAIALFIITAIGLGYKYYFANHNPCEKGIEESEIPKPIKQVVSTPVETPLIESAVVVDSIETKKAEVQPLKMVKMSPGRTLRLIALEKFGDREFWVYIYMKNKDKIQNPDVIPIGLELALPNMDEYPMDATNSDHVAKAKSLGDGVMKGLW
jgi:nucleoid DNA-binding protein